MLSLLDPSSPWLAPYAHVFSVVNAADPDEVSAMDVTANPIEGSDWPVKQALPFVPGHEGVGVVAGVGAGVSNVVEGDRVGVPWLYTACGWCEQCVRGWETLCAEQKNTGYSVDGGYADYVLADARFVGRLPAGLGFIEAAPILCAGVTTYKGIKETEAKPGEWIAISGIGGLGHVAIQYAKAMGLHIVALDVADEKLALARQLGAELAIDARAPDAAARIVKETGGGAHGVLVTAVSVPAFNQALQLVRRKGTISLTGLPPGEFATPIFDVVLNQTTGVWTFTLLEPVKHSDSATEDNEFVEIGVIITDGNGDTATGSFIVEIDDDSPVLEISVNEQGSGTLFVELDETLGKDRYSAADVVRLRGSVTEEHTLAKRGARKLWDLLHTEDYVHALGALTGNQAVQQVKAGLRAIYRSGWQVAADANLAGETYPDQSLYPANSVPSLVRRIGNALRRADQIAWSGGEVGTYWMAPIVADAEAGFGGPLNAFELMKALIEAGAAGVHFEDQLASEKKCGHLGGKVLVPSSQFARTLTAAGARAILDGPIYEESRNRISKTTKMPINLHSN